MRKRHLLPGALRAIRSLKAASDPQFRGGTGPAVGMSHAHLCNVEAGRRPLSDEAIEVVADALGVPVDAISYELPQEAVA